MTLEVGSFPINDVRFGSMTRWHDGVLEVDRDEIMGLILQEALIHSAKIDVVRPGDSTRVVNYSDVIEPRVKVRGSGQTYPGICGRLSEKTGEGRTHRLSNFAVVECIDSPEVPTDARATRQARSRPGPPIRSSIFPSLIASAISPNTRSTASL